MKSERYRIKIPNHQKITKSKIELLQSGEIDTDNTEIANAIIHSYGQKISISDIKKYREYIKDLELSNS